LKRYLEGAMAVQLKVNGRTHVVDVAPETPLLYVLRDELELNAAKFGCGIAQCGACTIAVDGAMVRSCITPVATVAGREILTVEGLGTPDHPHPLQTAFTAEQAAQCGYCIAGMIMAAQAILAANPHASDLEIREQMAGNLCRCGTPLRILRAIERAQKEMGT
jgi:nicotinate dehydrogenase subunit A